MSPGSVGASFNVVMAAYNASATVEAAIESVLGQTRPDFELIVVDDGSTDDTARKVDRFRRDHRVRLLRQTNRGLPAARNAAIAAGRARYITILDSDDLLMPTYLERVGRALEAAPQAGLAFGDAWRLDDRSGRFWRRTVMIARGAPRPVPTDAPALLEALVRSNFVPIMFTVRRAALEHVGNFRDGERELAEDWELLLRLAASGYTASAVPAVLGIYRRNVPGSFTIDHERMLRLSRETLRVFVAEHSAPDEVKAVALGRINHFERKLEAKLRGRDRDPLVAARRRLGGPISLIRGDPLRRRRPHEIAVAFPELGQRRR
jgi:glycosyltransferase involved in cell wall biosynthesis